MQTAVGKGPAGIFQVCAVLACLARAATANAADVTNDTTADTEAAATTFGGSVPRTNRFVYGADVGVGFSDNITQTSTNRRSEEIFGEGVQFSGIEQSARFQGEMLGDFEHLNFLQGTYSPEVLGNFNGMASVTVVPELLRWMAADSFGQGLIDPFASATPNNREYINTITTGPTLTFALDSLTLLNLTARYSRVTYQIDPLNNNDYGGGVSLARLLSARSRLSVNVQTTRFAYTSPAEPSYDVREAFARYDIQGARTHISLDAGYDQIRGNNALNSSGFLGRLSASRTLAPGSVLALSAGREYSSSSAFVGQSQGVNGVSLEATPGRQSATPFVNAYESLTWAFTRRRTTLDLTLSHYKQNYDRQSVLNQTLTSADVRLSRILYPAWTVTAFADFSKAAFNQAPGSYNQKHARLEVKWQMARELALLGQYDYYNRDSSLALYNYAENRLWLRLQYGNGTPDNRLMTGGFSGNAMSTDSFNIPTPAH